MSEFQSILNNQQRFFRDGHTKPLEFRIEQLNTLKTLLKKTKKYLLMPYIRILRNLRSRLSAQR